MAMTRDPVVSLTGLSWDNLPSDMLVYPLHGDGNSAITGMTALTANGTGDFNTQGSWSAPTNNTTSYLGTGNSTSVDGVMSLSGSSSTVQLIIACEYYYGVQDGQNGYLWMYGNIGSTHSCLAFRLQDANPTVSSPNVRYRAFSSAVGLVTSAMTLVSGSEIGGDSSGNRVSMVFEIRKVSSTNADFYLACSKGGATTQYSLLNQDLSQGGSALPGRNGNAGHNGLTLGAGYASNGTTVELFLGAGAGNTARIGMFQARRFATTDTGRRNAVLADIVARPRDISLTLRA